MKHKLNYFLKLLIIPALLVFFGCEVQENIIDNHSHEEKNVISFKKFLEKTKIKNFDFQINTGTNDNQSLSARQSSDFTSFVVDTTKVKELMQEDGNFTFTLSVIPVPHQNTENLFYNIVFYKENSTWEWSVLEYEKKLTEAKGYNVKEIVNDFNNNGLVAMRMIGEWSTSVIVNCVGCKGTCDLCEECVTIRTTFNYVDSEDLGLQVEIIAPTDSNLSLGGGSLFEAGLALADNFANTTLSTQQKLIYQSNPSIREYLAGNIIFVEDPLYNPILGGNPTKMAIDPQAIQFIKEIINLAIDEPNQEDVKNLVNLTFLIEDSGDNLFTEEFAEQLIPFINIHNGILPEDYPISHLTIKTFITYKKLRQLNPEWSRAKCIWHATKEIVHISLDAFGLVPVIGEPADLTNGALYLIEGDNLNASLSVASAVPVTGWAAVSVKYAVKVEDISTTAYTISTKIKLVWKVTGQVISFGSRSQLRKVLGLLPGNPLQAHHLIPWASQTKMAVQKAAKYGSAFHMNEALNGIAVAAWRNQPNHNIYNNVINSKLDAFRNLNPNATPQECYEFLTDLIEQIRTWVINHPNSHLNDLVLP